MKSAWLRAGIKLGIGLFLVVAAISVRIVAVSAVDREGDLVASGVRAEQVPGDRPVDGLPSQAGATALVSQADAVRSETPDTHEPTPQTDSKSRSGDRMVSCRIADSVHFMTADDCGMRGGRAKVVQIERARSL